MTPATQSRLEAAAHVVVLRFDQTVTITPGAIEVFTADGHRSRVPRSSVDGTGVVVRVALRGLKRGEAYTVRWRATSSDGHTGAGVYTFGIGVTPPPPTEAFGLDGSDWTDDVARWAYFVSLALLLGTIGLRLLVLRDAAARRALEPALRGSRRRRRSRRSTSASQPS